MQSPVKRISSPPIQRAPPGWCASKSASHSPGKRIIMRSCGSSVRVSAVSGSAPDAVVSSAVVIFVSATGVPFLPECVESAAAIGRSGCVVCRLSVPCSGLAVWAEAAGIVWVVPGPTVRARLSRAKPAGIPAVGCRAAGDGTVGSDAAWSGCAAASMCSAACAVSADSAFSAASAASLYAATRSE